MTEPTAIPGAVNPFAEGLGERRLADPCVVVLFGASGDLTRRKLVPALYNLTRDGHAPRSLVVIGFARRPWSDEVFRERLDEGVTAYARGFSTDDGLWERLRETTFYVPSSFDDESGYRALAERLRAIDSQYGTNGNRLFYLSTAPEWFAPVVERLGEAGLSRAAERSWTRVIVEKPFGQDLNSAVDLNHALHEVLHEDQIYRIDHYLGKETVQNILAFRFANGIFEPIWHRNYIDHVQITVAEDLGIGDRGPYYEAAGALRDMVQNHMMQLLALVAMEPPASLGANSIRDEKVKVLRALRPIRGEEVDRRTVRAQYASGSILGRAVAGYLEETRVDPDSTTPSYCAFRVDIDNWRWAGVPFFLRHGKRLPKRATEIAIRFRRPPMRLFGEATANTVAANTLILNIQPDEGISLCFGSKVPGPDIRVRQVKMDFRYGHSFGVPSPDAYERLLLDAMIGDSTLFTRSDEVEHSWRFVDPILERWAERGHDGLASYSAGTWGPDLADDLFEGLDAEWRRL